MKLFGPLILAEETNFHFMNVGAYSQCFHFYSMVTRIISRVKVYCEDKISCKKI